MKPLKQRWQAAKLSNHMDKFRERFDIDEEEENEEDETQ